MQIPVTIAFVWAEGSRLIKHTEIGEQEGGVVWTKVEVVMYPAYAFVAGTLVGMLGIGGGMLINPLLLELGVIPQVRPETCHLHEIVCHYTSGGWLQIGNVRGHAPRGSCAVNLSEQADLCRAKQSLFDPLLSLSSTFQTGLSPIRAIPLKHLLRCR